MLPPWKPERSVSARTESRPGLSFRTEGRTRTQSSPLSLTMASCRFLSAYTLRRRSGKIRLSKRKPPCPALSPAPIPVMQTRRETCSAFIALDERARRGREKRHLAERACRRAERADDGVRPLRASRKRFFVAGVADDELGALEIACLLGGTHQRGDVVPSRQRLADDQAAGAAGRSKDQYLRLERPDRRSRNCCMDAPLEAGRLLMEAVP